jgi:hypothetical protein
MKTAAIFSCLGVLLAVCAAGCAAGDDGDTEGGAAAVTGTDPATKTATSDLTPAYWNVDALADSPSPGSEPLNVILTTNVPMDTIVAGLPKTRNPEQGLATWKSAPLGVGLAGCISEERATIDGAPATVGHDAQTLSLRLGLLQGCDGVLLDGESHARGWKSQKRSTGKDDAGRTIETWYLALSQEHVCIVDDNGTPKPWHCILPQGFSGTLPGISGKIFTAPEGGYNQGRDQFVANLKRLPEFFPWKVECTSIERASTAPNGAGTGAGLFVPVSSLVALTEPNAIEDDPRNPGKKILKRVTWDSKATHCTITQ